MLYGTCTITKALGASLYLIDCMWCYWKYVLGMYATMGVYCTYATVGVYCMYAKITENIGFLLLWTQCSTGQKCRLSVVVGCENCRLGFFPPLNTFCLVMLFSNECLNGWIYPPVMLSYTLPLFGCEPFWSPNKYFFFDLTLSCSAFFILDKIDWLKLVLCKSCVHNTTHYAQLSL